MEGGGLDGTAKKLRRSENSSARETSAPSPPCSLLRFDLGVSRVHGPRLSSRLVKLHLAAAAALALVVIRILRYDGFRRES